ncbi:puromycin-sensitive aminopeptidase-like protein [Heterostelium album PN500]|uniref:Aminopeptidase n=1 Tax=Heterostelium pallidum (strain ATCC 26659 / Pp 5 / PN500) TaxID=670386 RepID=D3B8Z2_HETP5|nr:puromycin-sensitive aminopeptidase-like protein [Heterostelium album PN500]EFA82031.1 puromycin-sensitive aminopeptidase-like protein [Heterostelium album PN500]|eukprot:XP_020434148.1 puromycin-sensitive aminopeptidase-like protein [Heterostelium album PN500]
MKKFLIAILFNYYYPKFRHHYNQYKESQLAEYCSKDYNRYLKMCSKVHTNFLVEGKNGDRLVLPSKVVPSRYQLHLSPDVVKFVFDGQVDIDLRVVEETNVIVIHCLDIDIKHAEVAGQVASNIAFDTHDEVAIITFPAALAKGSTPTLKITYSGILNDKLKGFYRSKYVVNGEDRYIGTTQFEATDARRAFPCFDEPSLKAVFDIKITVPNHLTALSNMRDTETKDNSNGTKTVSFGQTPVMSTYLVAFVVGELSYVEGVTKGGVRTRIYQVIGKADTGDFALDVAIRALDFFCEYFQIPFPMDKCDHIAIPDFSFGAMENWGLITYRETILLTSPATALRTKKTIASVIGHELAHQWFGNLVTMEWWSQLWLNEGFATFMGDLVTNHLFPEWGVWLDFANMYRNGALGLDAMENSHPIEVPVYSSSQINEIFDAISYNKGACVIMMLASRYGENFRLGLTHYLNKFSYQNTNTEDLWDSIAHIAKSNVKEFIDSYTKYSGYPVITFRPTSTPGQFELSQKQFRFAPKEGAVDPLWNCYIKVQTDNGEHELVLSEKSTVVTIPNFNANGWMKPNFGQAGYYRIAYDESIIKSLLPQIQSMKLPAVDRLGLLSDSVSLSKAGQLPITAFLDLAAASTAETEFTIWSYIIDSLTRLSQIVERCPFNSELNNFLVKLLTPVSKKLGFDPIQGEAPGNVLLREKVNTRLGVLGQADIVAESRKRFEQLKSGQSIPSDVRSVVFATVIANGGENEYNQLVEFYKASKDNSERQAVLQVIGQSSVESLVAKALDFSLSTDVRSQDTFIVWLSVNHKLRDHSWKYFVQNFDDIYKKFQESGLFHRMISATMTATLTPEKLKVVEQFFEQHSIPIAERSIKQDLESIYDNNRWLAAIESQVNQWLQSHK